MNKTASPESLNLLIKNIKTTHPISKSIEAGIQSITEISSGNVNQVFKVAFNDGFSCIAKYAPPFAYRYQEIAINNSRNTFEANIIQMFFKENNSNYPEILHQSEQDHLMLMQDLSHCTDMREALIQGKTFEGFSEKAENIFSLYPPLENVSLKVEGTPFTLNDGIPELQNITKDFVFQGPFGLMAPDGFICFNENKPWISDHIFNNKKILNEREKLENLYNNKKETLLHGDLHTGSIMLSDSDVYIIDPEFAKLGPISFDIGMLIGNLVISHIASHFHLKDNMTHQCEFQNWIRHCISNTWSNTTQKLIEKGLNKKVLDEEIAGFCGIEIIRRTIGGAQAKDFTSIYDQKARANIELTALKIAVWILENTKKSNIVSQTTDKLACIQDILL